MWCPLRGKIAKYETRVAIEAEERQKELADKVAAATLEQIEDNVASDLRILRSQLPKPETAAAECQMDMKYIRDRQRRLA